MQTSQQQIHTTEEVVTPELATKWLEGNTDNRPISDTRVTRYATDMAAGQWLLTHQAIAFTDSGRILDGQHRLWAIIQAGTPVTLMVSRGCDPATFTVIDLNKTRSQSDALAIAGIAESYRLPGLLKIVRLYDEHRNDLWDNRNSWISNEEAVAMAQKVGQPAIDAALVAREIRRVARAGPLPAYGAATYLIARESGITPEQQKTMFWEPYATGVGLGKGDPRLALKRTVDRNYVGKAGSSPHITRPYLGSMLKAWNAFASGKDVQVLAFRSGENMPSVNKRFHPQPVT